MTTSERFSDAEHRTPFALLRFKILRSGWANESQAAAFVAANATTEIDSPEFSAAAERSPLSLIIEKVSLEEFPAT